jgi:hypothetical protein
LELAAETDYLHFLHTDDVLRPNFLARSMEVLNNVSGQGISWCQAEFIDEHGRAMPPLVKSVPGPPERVSLDAFLKERARLWGDIFVSGTMMKTNRQPIPCRFREDFTGVGDHYFWAQWAAQCAGRVRLREVLLRYRLHPLSVTSLNQTNLSACVHEDWEVIRSIEAMRGNAGFGHWLRMQMLRCLFAAIVCGKVEKVRDRGPEYARQVCQAGRGVVPLPHWWLGNAAFDLRKLLRSLRGE